MQQPDFDIIRTNQTEYINSMRQLFDMSDKYASFHESKIRINAQLDGASSRQDLEVLKKLGLLAAYLDEAVDALLDNHDSIDFRNMQFITKNKENKI